MVVQTFGDHGGDIYVKGAPECMKEICHLDSCRYFRGPLFVVLCHFIDLYSTVPMDYDEILGFYTQRGFRVIACATKHVEHLDKARVQAMSRNDAESGLQFVGFIIFENKLKPVSAAIINELNEAGIRQVMCTGDNILTAISVARECQLIDPTAHCFVPQFYEGIGYRPITFAQAYAEPSDF